MTKGALFLNPGTSPVADATEEQALSNLCALVKDALGDHYDRAKRRRIAGDDGDGYFGWDVLLNGRTCPVLMPGGPLATFRFLHERDCRVVFPQRVYVDGNSWDWPFAVRVLQDVLWPEEANKS